MRLTDRPKSLAEMKPDRSWPADVQAVMDRALERDVSARYQHATEFGMALYNAIQRMPETVAAEAGTALMGAVPPTRISAAAAVQNVNGGATVAAPVAQNFGSPVSGDTAPAPNKSKVALYATAAGVVVIGAVAAKLMMGGPKVVAADTTHGTDSATRTASAVIPSGTGATEFSKKDSTSPGGDSAAKSSVPATGSPDNGTATNKPLEDQITALYSAADDKAQGAAVLAAASRLERSARTGMEFAYLGIVRSKVAAAKGDSTGACTELKKAFPKAKADGREKLQARVGPGGLDGCKLPE